ncbi:hypothetical protein SEPCBS119000_000700 [Sporothrix epigloea]|uniref:SET domain-containing protein n=1 Tax=Sporothrix epigloea TaxID=1892477 RepID=A0ABP0D922_9PEZI
MAGPTEASSLVDLLEQRQQLSDMLQQHPYDLVLYLRRAVVYTDMGYPDLAASDAFQAYRLCCDVDEVACYLEAFQAIRGYAVIVKAKGEPAGLPRVLRGVTLEQNSAVSDDEPLPNVVPQPDEEPIPYEPRPIANYIADVDSGGHDGDYNPADLPDRGFARREVYPWNTFEPQRCSDASLTLLNQKLARVAPKCEVRAVQLPVLSAQGLSESAAALENWQLGIFAKEPIAAGEVVLREHSVLTANNRHKAEACDACGSDIFGTNNATDNRHSNVDSTVGCNHCCAVFCGEECYGRALDAYHLPACRWKDFIPSLKDWNPQDANDELYMLLVTRVLAIAESQKLHSLELEEVKYLWGDFVPIATNAQEAISSHHLSPYSPEVVAMAAAGGYPPAAWSLPFNFLDHIIKPVVFLEMSRVNIYKNPVKLDGWVLNTLYAKLRGTASARESRLDDPPFMAAVHPLWSLANHDCDPNVTWEWDGCMVLRAKEERVQLAEDKVAGTTRPGGIAAGEEILNHYCDVDLPVQLRREWVRGSLGGTCMCLRCQDEAAAERGIKGRCPRATQILRVSVRATNRQETAPDIYN